MKTKKYLVFSFIAILLFINLKIPLVYGESSNDFLSSDLENIPNTEENDELSVSSVSLEDDNYESDDIVEDADFESDDTLEDADFESDDIVEDTDFESDDTLEDADFESDDTLEDADFESDDTLEDEDVITNQIPYAGISNIILVALVVLIIFATWFWSKIRLMKNI